MDKITNYNEIALSRIPSYFKDKEDDIVGLPELLIPLCNQIQEIENVMFDILEQVNYQNATGEILKLFAHERNINTVNLTDDQIRLLIYADITIDWSNSTRVDIISILKTLGSSSVFVKNLYPAGLQVEYDTIPFDKDIIKTLLINSTAPINLDIYKKTILTGYLGFFGDPNALGLDVGVLG